MYQTEISIIPTVDTHVWLNCLYTIEVFYCTVSIVLGSDTPLMDEDNAILKYGHQFADYLGRGLADNWSQVWSFKVLLILGNNLVWSFKVLLVLGNYLVWSFKVLLVLGNYLNISGAYRTLLFIVKPL